jgi:hypothetical protein
MRRGAVTLVACLLTALGGMGSGAATGAARADVSTVVGQWRFDEPGGQTAVDDGPFALDGRFGLDDGVDARDPQRIPGASGGALHFDGTAFVRLPAAAELQPSTLALEAVVRASSSPGEFRYVVSHGAQSCLAGSYGLYTAADGGLAFYVFDGAAFRVSAAIAPAQVWDGAWHHAAGVFDGSAIRFYLDGHPVGDPLAAPATIAYGLASLDTFFGTYQGSCELPLRGDLDLVRLWHGPLAPDTLARLSDAALAAPLAPPPGGPIPGTVPHTDASGSDAGASGGRTRIAPIADGQSIPLNAPPPSGSRPGAAPGAPARACSVHPSSRRLHVGRRTRLTVRVALRGKPLKAVRVIAFDVAARRRLVTGRTAKDGRVRLAVTPRRRGIIRLKVLGRADCGSAALTVSRTR